MIPILLTAFLAASGAGGPPISTAPAASLQDLEKAYTDLLREFEEHAFDWRRELRDARRAKDAQKEEQVLARNPVRDYYPRFAELSKQGSAYASLWMSTRVEDVETEAEKITATKRELFRVAIKELGAGPEAKTILKGLSEQEKFLPAEELEAMFLELAKLTQDEEIGAKALYERGKSILDRAQDDPTRELGVKALEELMKRYPESKPAKSSEGLVYEFRYLRVGCSAPDFSAEDVDGTAFKLSDYRGKVVLLDFWGFW